jgi:tetratricopeptide (TPR) repeat protein
MLKQFAEPQTGADVVQLLLEKTRPFEAQLAGQPHRPLQRTRGAERDAGVSYKALTEAMIGLVPGNYEMGRFYLVQKEFSRAIPYLESASRESGATAAVHNDLGVAYFESGNSWQMEKAEAEFLRAAMETPAFPPAVFNLALFYERTNAIPRAEAQWRRYLELDSRSNWALEAQERLQGSNR